MKYRFRLTGNLVEKVDAISFICSIADQIEILDPDAEHIYLNTLIDFFFEKIKEVKK